ncbi:hypothetical protein OG339_48405 (plasmid) [Streptosporangium sp. NBC_01495]|uniref:hypothetical protein n=1 Tax=Streptosporangium sp. NBC_01495 TaxID=2903899 RepID=UPI002E2FB1BB|nr:hypothetical protein [Streptosporangium sp. NBC_01495]
MKVKAFGNTPVELELYTLDEARAFFGGDTRLAIMPSWHAQLIHPLGALAQETRSTPRPSRSANNSADDRPVPLP